MKILGIDSSGLVSSVAVLEEETLLGERMTNLKKTHSETLMPALSGLLSDLSLTVSDLNGIAVAAGPGSFTGLRIGSATAKGLALVSGIPIVPVPTVDAMAWNLWGASGLICPMMDARRDRVYTGVYTFTDGELCAVLPQCVMELEELYRFLSERSEPVTLLGDGADKYRKQLDEWTDFPISYAPATQNRQRAGSVAVLGRRLLLEGKGQEGRLHHPDYLLFSQAEQERMKKENNS